jgi:transposase-like protein
MKCPNCEQTASQHKAGQTKAGSQRYRCYYCRTIYTPDKKKAGYSASVRQKAIRQYVDGGGFRRIGRQLGVSHQSVANWVKDHAENLPQAVVPPQVKTAEFDEIFTYIGDKKTESISLRLLTEKLAAF